jgi:hypothetical protein
VKPNVDIRHCTVYVFAAAIIINGTCTRYHETDKDNTVNTLKA